MIDLLLFPKRDDLITVEVIPTFTIVEATLPVKPKADFRSILEEYLGRRKYQLTDN